MLKKIISLITSVCFLIYIIGCSSTRLVSKSEFYAAPGEFRIASYTTLDGDTGEFVLKKRNPVLEDSVLYGQLKDGKWVNIRLSEINSITVWEYDSAANACLGLGTLGFILGLVFLTVDINWEFWK